MNRRIKTQQLDWCSSGIFHTWVAEYQYGIRTYAFASYIVDGMWH